MRKTNIGKLGIKGGQPFLIDKNSKTGILLLHGFTSTPYQFRELGEYLASNGFTIFAPLIAGHGTCPEDLAKTTTDDWKNSVKEAYLTLQKKVQKIIIIGNSFGGNLAFYLAKEFQNDSLIGVISLGTPIMLRFQWFIKLRLYLYGWLKEYYRKPAMAYRLDYTDMADEVTYPLIPIKSLREFFKFIKKETIPGLREIKVPTLIIHANVDFVVNPKSTIYIHQHLGSQYKAIHWVNCSRHLVINSERRQELFERIYNFIKEIT
ncbi:MAG: hypothetical protein COU42_00990 [Candidatus Nealsonbacteria bacterium CG10_big_fil_rev_8_21_14_0_10_36_24]|uniref:Serine aminopeptidase S33 domain-containing protein n=2 Tax=Candidatus Nealsoniibacteriota TaxID=1817911 RepID=A0A2H0YN83_9BACT|nr:MAG: hypothetical protein COU42_00990 [Candidatus Nealsonbacteria bacterium CG10_big_fil_rev_8_21_14_0_10_36_24]PIS39961.1 MAG: hypothetical protein COT32_02295 [Candidatus Nealsonbacteria bacterium CG08_land_8_20_14_0_20_36_22]